MKYSPLRSHNVRSIEERINSASKNESDKSKLFLSFEKLEIASDDEIPSVANVKSSNLLSSNSNTEVISWYKFSFFGALIDRLRAFKFPNFFA